MNDAAFHNALALALKEEHGLLTVVLYEMSTPDLERLVDAAQLIDKEGMDALDARSRADDAANVREVLCQCGSITALVQPGMTLTNFRCWLCPKDDSRPALTLVRP